MTDTFARDIFIDPQLHRDNFRFASKGLSLAATIAAALPEDPQEARLLLGFATTLLRIAFDKNRAESTQEQS